MNCRRQGPHSADGSDVENASLSLPDHLLVNRLGDGEKTVDIRVDHFVPRAVGRSGKVIAAIDGSVIDQNIDAAPLLHQFARQAFSSRHDL